MCSGEEVVPAEKVQMALAGLHQHQLLAKLENCRFWTSWKEGGQGLFLILWNIYLVSHWAVSTFD